MSALAIDIVRDDAIGPETAALIEACTAELARDYPPECHYGLPPEALRASGACVLVAQAGGAPVGCGALVTCDGYAELKRIYVAPGARGSGIAGRLLGALEAEARARGLPLVRLETGVRSPAALVAYERAGYARCPAFGDYVEDGWSVFMEKRL